MRFSANNTFPDSRIRRNKVKPKGRICETEDCKVVLSIYNDNTICAGCHTIIPLENLPTNIGRYL